ncbi:MAG: PQQ-binding-like beta-propeller repeat protein [Dehalococcoidales bacterium]|nr:PQQ-binding-like beta-propeller repeat protein [Dehalococcoidales bacterium]
MKIRQNKKLLYRVLLPLMLLSLCGLAFSSCTGTSGRSVPKGWSGGALTDGALIIGAMDGRLVAVDTGNGSLLWAEPIKTAEKSGGLFSSCAPAPAAVAIYGTPVVSGDLIYFGGYNGKIYAISHSTLLSKDKYLKKDAKSSSLSIIGSAAVANGNVYIGSSDGCVYALDAISLDMVWEKPFETGDKIWSTPAISDDTLFIGSFDKKLYALDINTGTEKWDKPFETGGAIVSTPVVYNNTVYIGSFDRYLYAINATDGSLRWKSKSMAENWFWAKPVIYGNSIYAPCLDGKIYILNTETGNEVAAAIELESPISSSPVLVGDSIIMATQGIAGTKGGVLYSVDTGSNQPRRLTDFEENVYAPLVADERFVYVHTVKDTVYAVDAQSGAVLPFVIKD